MLEHVVVVGASLAGLRAVESLRSDGYGGRITVIGAEPHLPYDRPPLSKQFLAGDWDAERIALRKHENMAMLDADWRLGVAAAGLDVAGARRCALVDGTVVGYDGLILATGAAPRSLPGQPEAAGIHLLRTLGDSMALREAIGEGTRLVVIGAGFIGLEVAATARKRGAEVVVLEGLPAPLVRALGAEMGTAVAAVHGRNGVEIRCDVRVEAIEVDERARHRRAPGRRRGAARRRRGRRHRRRAGHRLAGRQRLTVGEGPGTDGVWCDATLDAAAGRRRARVRRRRHGPLGPARADGAPRALDQRRRAGRVRRPQPAALRRGRRTPRRTCRCRSSGATSTTPGSSSSATPGPTTRCRWSPATSARASSSPSTTTPTGSPAPSA